ncbi:MAG: hypothetical protein NVSMB27_14830 [Ktedonobacteraceae bacterium]
MLRDDMTRRILDRMEAAEESVERKQALKKGLLAAYDGVLRIRAGRLLTKPDPRGDGDAIAALLGELATQHEMAAPEMVGILLTAALRAALTQALDGHSDARLALESLLN